MSHASYIPQRIENRTATRLEWKAQHRLERRLASARSCESNIVRLTLAIGARSAYAHEAAALTFLRALRSRS